jgi:hypothetical protein
VSDLKFNQLKLATHTYLPMKSSSTDKHQSQDELVKPNWRRPRPSGKRIELSDDDIEE